MAKGGNLESNRPTTDDPLQNAQYEIREEIKQVTTRVQDEKQRG